MRCPHDRTEGDLGVVAADEGRRGVDALVAVDVERVEDDAGRDADVGLGPALPSPANDVGIGTRILEAVERQRVLRRTRAPDAERTCAMSVHHPPHREHRKSTSRVLERRVDHS
jgi:hypothetical protein